MCPDVERIRPVSAQFRPRATPELAKIRARFTGFVPASIGLHAKKLHALPRERSLNRSRQCGLHSVNACLWPETRPCETYGDIGLEEAQPEARVGAPTVPARQGPPRSGSGWAAVSRRKRRKQKVVCAKHQMRPPDNDVFWVATSPSRPSRRRFPCGANPSNPHPCRAVTGKSSQLRAHDIGCICRGASQPLHPGRCGRCATKRAMASTVSEGNWNNGAVSAKAGWLSAKFGVVPTE